MTNRIEFSDDRFMRYPQGISQTTTTTSQGAVAAAFARGTQVDLHARGQKRTAENAQLPLQDGSPGKCQCTTSVSSSETNDMSDAEKIEALYKIPQELREQLKALRNEDSTDLSLQQLILEVCRGRDLSRSDLMCLTNRDKYTINYEINLLLEQSVEEEVEKLCSYNPAIAVHNINQRFITRVPIDKKIARVLKKSPSPPPLRPKTASQNHPDSYVFIAFEAQKKDFLQTAYTRIEGPCGATPSGPNKHMNPNPILFLQPVPVLTQARRMSIAALEMEKSYMIPEELRVKLKALRERRDMQLLPQRILEVCKVRHLSESDLGCLIGTAVRTQIDALLNAPIEKDVEKLWLFNLAQNPFGIHPRYITRVPTENEIANGLQKSQNPGSSSQSSSIPLPKEPSSSVFTDTTQEPLFSFDEFNTDFLPLDDDAFQKEPYFSAFNDTTQEPLFPFDEFNTDPYQEW